MQLYIYISTLCAVAFLCLTFFYRRRWQRTAATLAARQTIWNESGKQDALGTLAGGIAHDFNNILGSIIGFGVLLEEDLTAHPDKQFMAQHILTAARRGQDIVLQLMRYSRTHIGDSDSDGGMTDVSLDKIAGESVALLATSIRRSTRVTYHCDPMLAGDNSVVIADPTQLSQVIINLCLNADHAIGVGTGEISIKLAPRNIHAPDIKSYNDGDQICIVNGTPKTGSYLSLSVTDNGEGMTADIAKRAFEPFFTTRAVDRGTGLGLAALQGIVHAHDGFIIMTTKARHGTTFDILLPRRTVATQPPVNDSTTIQHDAYHQA